MKRALLAILAAAVVIAATPEEAVSGLVQDGFYIEPGSGATESVVSNAVFDGRADGGRLYIVVLAEDPPGGATTFADSALDLLDGDGYVFVVAPETIGYAGDGTFWTTDQLDAAVEAALDGETDDEVVELFVTTLTSSAPGAPVDPDEPAGETGGGISLLWVVVVIGGAVALFVFLSRRSANRRIEGRMSHVRGLAREKLDAVANDILEMEDEVSTSDSDEVKGHYQRASSLYAEAMDANSKAATVEEMMKVSEQLDLAIWELDCAEALLDGKPKPPKPEPPAVSPPSTAPQAEPGRPPTPSTSPSSDFERRPQRQSSGSGDMLNVLLTMMAMSGMRNRGGGFGGFGGGSSGGWTGSGGGAPRPPMGGGGGGGRIRGGGRRRG